jgi:hypothetical protein
MAGILAMTSSDLFGQFLTRVKKEFLREVGWYNGWNFGHDIFRSVWSISCKSKEGVLRGSD